MLVLPLSGWLFNSAAGFPLQWFGLFNLPSLTGGRDDGLRHLAIEVHETAWWILVAVLVAHAGAALKHHFLDRDDTLRRMWPFGLPRRQAADAALPDMAPPVPSDPTSTDEPAKDARP
jgi:cytochrome b561